MTAAINPADVDVVLRVEAAFYDSAVPEQQAFMNDFFRPGTAAEAYRCDAFLFCEFPPGHPSYKPGIREYWLRQYGLGNDEVTPKGIAVVAVGGGLS